MIKKWFDTFIDAIGYVIIKASPVIAAFPAAITILEAAGYTLEAWVKVGGIEFMGYAIGHAAVDMVRRKWLTLRQVAIGIGVYCLVIEGMLLGYDVAPAWNSWWNGGGSFTDAAQSTVSLLLPAFTLAGAALYAYWQYKDERTQIEREDRDRDRSINDQRAVIDLDMYRREREQALELKREQAETSNRIREQNAAAKVAKPESNGDSKPDSENQKGLDYEFAVIDYFAKNPLASQRTAANETGISQSKISKTLADLESRKIIHRNGSGVEILREL